MFSMNLQEGQYWFSYLAFARLLLSIRVKAAANILNILSHMESITFIPTVLLSAAISNTALNWQKVGHSNFWLVRL